MQLVLIGGAQRSGTTLLQTLLANAVGSPVLPEAHILADILASYKRAKEFGKKTLFFYPSEGDLRSFFRSFADRHIGDVVKTSKPSEVLVLKDPNFAKVLDETAELLPDAIRLVCVRDPRDIAASFVQIGARQTGGKPSKYKKRDIGYISQKILESYAPLVQPQPNVLIVRYEELASDPGGTLQELGRATNLNMTLDRLEQPVWLDAEARHEGSWISALEGGKASPASIGSFRKVLRGDEIEIVQTICAPVMQRFGYAPIEDWTLRRDRMLKRVGLRRTRSWTTSG